MFFQVLCYEQNMNFIPFEPVNSASRMVTGQSFTKNFEKVGFKLGLETFGKKINSSNDHGWKYCENGCADKEKMLYISVHT